VGKEVTTLRSEVPKNVEGQSGPSPSDRCAECGHPMRRTTDRVDYKFFTLDTEGKTMLGHFSGVIRGGGSFVFPKISGCSSIPRALRICR
jgi:hypothetical protein